MKKPPAVAEGLNNNNLNTIYITITRGQIYMHKLHNANYFALNNKCHIFAVQVRAFEMSAVGRREL